MFRSDDLKVSFNVISIRVSIGLFLRFYICVFILLHFLVLSVTLCHVRFSCIVRSPFSYPGHQVYYETTSPFAYSLDFNDDA